MNNNSKEIQISNRATKIKELHFEIINNLKIGIDNAIEIGQQLCEQKMMVPRGFISWTKKNLPFSYKTAKRYMNVFENKDRLKLDTVSNLTLTKVYKLLEPPKPKLSDKKGKKSYKPKNLLQRTIESIYKINSDRDESIDETFDFLRDFYDNYDFEDSDDKILYASQVQSEPDDDTATEYNDETQIVETPTEYNEAAETFVNKIIEEEKTSPTPIKEMLKNEIIKTLDLNSGRCTTESIIERYSKSPYNMDILAKAIEELKGEDRIRGDLHKIYISKKGNIIEKNVVSKKRSSTRYLI